MEFKTINGTCPYLNELKLYRALINEFPSLEGTIRIKPIRSQAEYRIFSNNSDSTDLENALINLHIHFISSADPSLFISGVDSTLDGDYLRNNVLTDFEIYHCDLFPTNGRFRSGKVYLNPDWWASEDAADLRDELMPVTEFEPCPDKKCYLPAPYTGFYYIRMWRDSAPDNSSRKTHKQKQPLPQNPTQPTRSTPPHSYMPMRFKTILPMLVNQIFLKI